VNAWEFSCPAAAQSYRQWRRGERPWELLAEDVAKHGVVP
jgi:hypothetical protein